MAFRALMPLLFCLTAAWVSGVGVDYYDHVRPIIRQHCISCHHSEGIGPFSLETYEEVSRRRRQIAEVVESGFMPPWPPEPDLSAPIIGQRILTESEIQNILNWHKTGASEGKRPTNPESINPNGRWPLGEPNLILTLDEAYTLQEEGLDVYRNFVISVPLDEIKYVRAIDIHPESNLAIHHALITVDTTGRAREQDRIDPQPGYPGMGIGSSEYPSGHFIGWTPGQIPYESYPGTAWEIAPGSDLVLQLHMLPNGRKQPINPEIGLYFAKEAPTLESFIIQMRNFDIDIPAGEANYIVHEEFEVPVDISIVGVYPHAHYLGKKMELLANSPNGTTTQILTIPQWDFNWQSDYRFKEPINLAAGSKLVMRYSYDNSESNIFNPNSPPVNVKGGWKSTDEMAEAVFQVILGNPEDEVALKQAQNDYDIAAAGGESLYHYYMGTYLLEQGESMRAFEAFNRSLSFDPDFLSAHYQIGVIMLQQSNFDEAERAFNKCLELNENHGSSMTRLGEVYYLKNQPERAIQVLERAYSEYPEDLQILLYLSRILTGGRRTLEAIELLESASDMHKNSSAFQLELAETLISEDRFSEALPKLNSIIEQYEKSVTDFTQPNDSENGIIAGASYRRAQILEGNAKLQDAFIDYKRSASLLPYDLNIQLTALEVSEQLREIDQSAAYIHHLVQHRDLWSVDPSEILVALIQTESVIKLAQAYASEDEMDTAFEISDLLLKDPRWSEKIEDPEALKQMRRRFLMESL